MRETISVERAAAMAGCYASGSLRPEDVVPAYRDILENVLSAAREEGCDPERIREAEKALKESEGAESSEWWDEACDQLASAAGWLLPEGWWVGGGEGDPTDIGIWGPDPEGE